MLWVFYHTKRCRNVSVGTIFASRPSVAYKVERGKVSFQCGTLSQKRLQVQHLVLRQKLSPQFQSKLLNTLKIIYYKLNFSYSCCLMVKLGRKLFGGCFLIQSSHYLWKVDVMLIYMVTG